MRFLARHQIVAIYIFLSFNFVFIQWQAGQHKPQGRLKRACTWTHLLPLAYVIVIHSLLLYLFVLYVILVMLCTQSCPVRCGTRWWQAKRGKWGVLSISMREEANNLSNIDVREKRRGRYGRKHTLFSYYILFRVYSFIGYSLHLCLS